MHELGRRSICRDHHGKWFCLSFGRKGFRWALIGHFEVVLQTADNSRAWKNRSIKGRLRRIHPGKLPFSLSDSVGYARRNLGLGTANCGPNPELPSWHAPAHGNMGERCLRLKTPALL